MSEAGDASRITAVVTTDPSRVQGGGAPVFVAREREEMERLAQAAARVTLGMVHQLAEDLLIVVRH